MSERSPTPWTVCDGAFWRIYDAGGAEVVNAEGVVGEDLSERIVHAVNLHDEMVAALRMVANQYEILDMPKYVVNAVDAALSKSTPTQEGE